jgi:hypothetical protein
MANELYSVTNMPLITAGYGIKTPHGILLPPGGRVAAYVRSTGLADYDDSAIGDNLVATLAAGLARCRAGAGDAVICLPGHSESVTDATMLDNLVAGTRIVGFGRGSNMPVFRWTATGSQWVLDNADVIIAGLRLRLEGANGVVKAIVVTAADCVLRECDIQVASGATAKATIALEIGTGADRCEIGPGNIWRGSNTHNVTDGIKLVGTNDGVYIYGNKMMFSATAANGTIHVTAATVTGITIAGNVCLNDHTASTACIACDAVASTGLCLDNYTATINNGVATAQGVVLGAGCLWRCFNNQSCDEPAKSGVLTPGPVAT